VLGNGLEAWIARVDTECLDSLLSHYELHPVALLRIRI